jgi:hypothetical protein
LALCLLFAVGCREEKKVEKAEGGETVAVKLAAADAYDGESDHVVSKCLTCGLRMKGSDDYAVTVEEYTVNLCGPECEAKFKKDTTKAILALQIPEK